MKASLGAHRANNRELILNGKLSKDCIKNILNG
jgi:hypothetical protein